MVKGRNKNLFFSAQVFIRLPGYNYQNTNPVSLCEHGGGNSYRMGTFPPSGKLIIWGRGKGERGKGKDVVWGRDGHFT